MVQTFVFCKIKMKDKKDKHFIWWESDIGSCSTKPFNLWQHVDLATITGLLSFAAVYSTEMCTHNISHHVDVLHVASKLSALRRRFYLNMKCQVQWFIGVYISCFVEHPAVGCNYVWAFLFIMTQEGGNWILSNLSHSDENLNDVTGVPLTYATSLRLAHGDQGCQIICINVNGLLRLCQRIQYQDVYVHLTSTI